MSNSAVLVTEDGSVFEGYSFGSDKPSVGEVIFNTSITGYQEILTDPSYAKQIITLTQPQIGNVGVNDFDVESTKVHASGLVIKSLPRRVSNWRAQKSLDQLLKDHDVPGIWGIDTRRLTRLIRSKGAQNACIVTGENNVEAALEKARQFEGLKGMDLAKVVSVSEPYLWEDGLYSLETDDIESRSDHKSKYVVAAFDFGVKHNILRMLAARGCSVKVVPAQTSFDELDSNIDGVFLSNGPGDPEPCDYAIECIRAILTRNIPIFGICLGHQLLALAAGARTMKMKFGHHGANHPVRDIESGEIMITSQNHGFAVDEDMLPEHLQVTHRSLFDGTIQGLRHIKHPAFSFQGHPEASPGPHDCAQLFDQFISSMQLSKQSIKGSKSA